MSYKSSKIAKSRKFANIEKLEWCETIENLNSVENPFVRNILQLMKIRMPHYFKKCPISGVISAINLKNNKNMLAMLPQGTYVLKLTLFNGNIGSAKQLILKFIMNYALVAD